MREPISGQGVGSTYRSRTADHQPRPREMPTVREGGDIMKPQQTPAPLTIYKSKRPMFRVPTVWRELVTDFLHGKPIATRRGRG